MVKYIAEFCQNHNGDPVILNEMIHQAKESGAAYGKIQTIFADDLSLRPEFDEGRSVDGKTVVIKRPYKAEYERLKKLELTYKEQAQFVDECRKVGLVPITTCFTRGAVAPVTRLGMRDVKIASYDCASLPLIKDLVPYFDRLIISTGATYDEEIDATACYLKNQDIEMVFLHCVTIYPTPLREINLKRMNYLKRYTPHIGLSEHTLTERDGIKASLAAIHLGAEYLERHFTILGPGESKDGPVSITPDQVKEMIAFSTLSHDDQKQYMDQNVPEFSEMLGQATRPLTHEELLNRSYYRGRFATQTDGAAVYNWEEKKI